MQTFSKAMAPVFTHEEIDDLACELTSAEIEAVSGGCGSSSDTGSKLRDAWSGDCHSYSSTGGEDDDHEDDDDHHKEGKDD